tara:strand:+ start:852 stop:1013 length:162 start_codon:yes stop_codon:yes gene_type:complete
MGTMEAAERVLKMDPAVPGVARLTRELLAMAYDIPIREDYVPLVTRESSRRWK